MNGRTLLAIVVLVVCAVAVTNPLSTAQPRPAGTSEEAPSGGGLGRYAVAACSEGTNQTGAIVVCDTKTGQCWKLRSGQNGRWEDQGTPVRAK